MVLQSISNRKEGVGFLDANLWRYCSKMGFDAQFSCRLFGAFSIRCNSGGVGGKVRETSPVLKPYYFNIGEASINVSFSKVGKITSGKYSGGELLVSRENWSEEVCKGVCNGFRWSRYVLLQKKLIYLPRNSAMTRSIVMMNLLFQPSNTQIR